ncbi:serpin family protein [Glycomyces tritici]|uniref:Serpin family protein n=1 Tax=Glycomyces tritici TaxID=2665176 RepID=A0ABT7YUU5_9ACTN|nr:serpin family protein [Glycomyces tritici]MDN3242411.1 serpin family protein [Glycomyces tritici]
MEQTTLQDALSADEITAANELTRRWLTARAEVPAVASGLGIWPLLAVLATGAVEATLEELLEAAGIDIGQAADVPAALLDAVRSAPALSLAVAAWAGPRVTLDPEWVAGLPGDAIGALTGDPAVDKPVLDDWASRNTGGLIDRMPVDLDESIELLLASALSVRTKWRTPFEEQYGPFRNGPWKDRGKVLSATYREEVLRVDPDAAVLTVAGHDDIDVLLAIGRAEAPPQEVMSTLIDAAADPRWGRPASEATPSIGVTFREYQGSAPQTAPETNAVVPAFTLDTDLDLLQDAAALGLELASDDEFAQFDRLAAQRLYISQAKQACTAVFSASGFEAAAVTAFGMAFMGSAPPQLIHKHRCAVVTFDRPFAYLARHRPSGLILIAGWVAEPGE